MRYWVGLTFSLRSVTNREIGAIETIFMTKFVIGIGSQRAGSTLLHKVLSECTSIFMHPIKELHYYDTLFGVRKPDILKEFSQRQLNRELDRLAQSDSHGYIDKTYRCYIRANKMLANNDVANIDYYDLYRPCIAENRLIGEITPEYMVLPEAGVQQMAEDLGKSTPIILISRDPVNRFISAFKLLKVYSGDNYDKNKMSEDILEVIDTMPEWIDQQIALGDYNSAQSLYERYFDNVLLLSYENDLNKPNLLGNKLQECLDIKVDRRTLRKITKTRLNKIGESGEVSPEVMSRLKELF